MQKRRGYTASVDSLTRARLGPRRAHSQEREVLRETRRGAAVEDERTRRLAAEGEGAAYAGTASSLGSAGVRRGLCAGTSIVRRIPVRQTTVRRPLHSRRLIAFSRYAFRMVWPANARCTAALYDPFVHATRGVAPAATPPVM